MILFQPIKSVRNGNFGALTANERFGRSIMNKYGFGSKPYLGMLNLLYLETADAADTDMQREQLYRFMVNLRLQLEHGRINKENNLFASQTFMVNHLEKLLMKQNVYNKGWKRYVQHLKQLNINGDNDRKSESFLRRVKERGGGSFTLSDPAVKTQSDAHARGLVRVSVLGESKANTVDDKLSATKQLTGAMSHIYRQSIMDTLWLNRFGWLTAHQSRSGTTSDIVERRFRLLNNRIMSDAFNSDIVQRRLTSHEEATRTVREYAEQYDILNRQFKLDWLVTNTTETSERTTTTGRTTSSLIGEQVVAGETKELTVLAGKPVKASVYVSLSVDQFNAPLEKKATEAGKSGLVSTERISRAYRRSITESIWSNRFHWLTPIHRQTVTTSDIEARRFRLLNNRSMSNSFDAEIVERRLTSHEEATRSVREYAEQYDLLNRQFKLEWLVTDSTETTGRTTTGISGEPVVAGRTEESTVHAGKPVKASVYVSLSVDQFNAPLEKKATEAGKSGLVSTERISRAYRRSITESIWSNRFHWLTPIHRQTVTTSDIEARRFRLLNNRSMSNSFDAEIVERRLTSHEEATRSVREYAEQYDILNRKLKLEWLTSDLSETAERTMDEWSSEAFIERRLEASVERRLEVLNARLENPIKASVRVLLGDPTISQLNTRLINQAAIQLIENYRKPLTETIWSSPSSAANPSTADVIRFEKVAHLPTLFDSTTVEKRLASHLEAVREIERIGSRFEMRMKIGTHLVTESENNIQRERESVITVRPDPMMMKQLKKSISEQVWTTSFGWFSRRRASKQESIESGRPEFRYEAPRGQSDIFQTRTIAQRLNEHHEAVRRLIEFGEKHRTFAQHFELSWLNDQHEVSAQIADIVKSYARIVVHSSTVSAQLPITGTDGKREPRLGAVSEVFPRKLHSFGGDTARKSKSRLIKKYRQSLIETINKYVTESPKKSEQLEKQSLYRWNGKSDVRFDRFDTETVRETLWKERMLLERIRDSMGAGQSTEEKVALEWPAHSDLHSQEESQRQIGKSISKLSDTVKAIMKFVSSDAAVPYQAAPHQLRHMVDRESIQQMTERYKRNLSESVFHHRNSRRLANRQYDTTTRSEFIRQIRRNRSLHLTDNRTMERQVERFLETVRMFESYGRNDRKLSSEMSVDAGMEWLFPNKNQQSSSVRPEIAEQAGKGTKLVRMLQAIRIDQRSLGFQTTESLKRYARTVFTPMELEYIGHVSSIAETVSSRSVSALPNRTATKTILAKVNVLRQVVKSLVRTEQASRQDEASIGGINRQRRNGHRLDPNDAQRSNDRNLGRPTLADLRNTADAISMVISRIGRSSSALSTTTAQTLSLLFHQAIERQSQSTDHSITQRREMQINETEKVVRSSPEGATEPSIASIASIVHSFQRSSFVSTNSSIRLPAIMMNRMKTTDHTLTHSTIIERSEADQPPFVHAAPIVMTHADVSPTSAPSAQDQPGSNIKPVQFDFNVETPSSLNGQQPIDIDAIADKVYKEIENRMRLEKMRRGY